MGAMAEKIGVTRSALECLVKDPKRNAVGYRTTRFEAGIRIAVLWWIVTRAIPVKNAPRRRATEAGVELARCEALVRAGLVSGRHRAG